MNPAEKPCYYNEHSLYRQHDNSQGLLSGKDMSEAIHSRFTNYNDCNIYIIVSTVDSEHRTKELLNISEQYTLQQKCHYRQQTTLTAFQTYDDASLLTRKMKLR